MDVSNTFYIPPYTFEEVDNKGYPMVQYLARSNGEAIEISEPVINPEEVKPLTIETPISQINSKMTATNFFKICAENRLYKLSYAQYPKDTGAQRGFFFPQPLTALAKAVSVQNSKLVKSIIEAVPNKNIWQKLKTDREFFVNQRMQGGLTTAIWTCFTLDQDQHEMRLKILKILIREGANLNLSLWEDLSPTLKKGDTCLSQAIKCNMPRLIKYLIINGGELTPDCAIINVVRLIDMIGIAQIKLISCIDSYRIFNSNLLFNNPPINDGINFYKCFQETTEEVKVNATNKYQYLAYYADQQKIPPELLKIIASIFITITLPSKFWWSGQNLPNEDRLSLLLKKYNIKNPVIFHPSESQEKAARLFSLAASQFYSDEKGYPMTHYSMRIDCKTSERWEWRRSPLRDDLFINACKSPIEMIEKDTTPQEFSQLCKQYPDYEFTHADRGCRDNDQSQCELRLTALARGVIKGNIELVQHLIEAVPNDMVCPKTMKTARELFVNTRMAGGLTAAFCIKNIKEYEVRTKMLNILTHAGTNLNLSMWDDYQCFKKGETVLSTAIAEDTELTQPLTLQVAKATI